MKEYLKRLFTDERFFGAVVVGVVAALVQAEIIAAWATLIAVAAFMPTPHQLGRTTMLSVSKVLDAPSSAAKEDMGPR